MNINDNLIFIHIPKCAGVAIRQSLKITVKGDMHENYCSIKEKDISKDRFIFSVVRNPFDRLVSWYYYHKNLPGYLFSGPYFKDWIKSSLDNSDYYGGGWVKGYDGDPLIMRAFLTEDGTPFGKIRVPFIGKVENLEKDIQKLSDIIGISLRKDIPIMNESNGRQSKKYRHYYDDETRKIVEKKYEIDLDEFKYSF